MPRNGAGVFNLVNNTWFPPSNGTLATSSDWTTFISDIASAMTQSVSSDGQTQMTGNLPMGNNKITGLANGTAATDAAAFGQIVQVIGQCQLVKSGANLVLQPYNGNKLFINGILCTVPAAGVSLAPGAFVVGTNYNIYAVATGTTVTSLEASTTARATDATYGNQIKAGDPTRVLVGKARPIAGPLWVDTDLQRLVISWFNRTPRRIYNTIGSNVLSASTTPVGVIPQMEFLSWGEGGVPVSFVGSSANNTANATVSTAFSLDLTLTFSHSPCVWQAYNSNVSGPSVGGTTFLPNEGFHFIILNGSVSGGTGTWVSGMEMSGVIQG